MLVNMNDILKNALNEGYAIPQFNINSLEWTKFILEECQEQKSAVILGITEKSVNYMGGFYTVFNVVKGLIKDLNISIPVVLHLDHGKSFESCKQAIENGFTSVMIDASKYPLRKNINITKEVVLYASTKGVSVEAELGNVGSYDNKLIIESEFTDVSDAVKFVSETGIDFLAPSIGNVHGIYLNKPELDFDRMKQISNNIKIPLVLHGASGLSDDYIKKSIKCGVSKININTELQQAWSKSVKKYLDNNDVFDPRKIIKSGELSMKKVIKDKIILFGSNYKIISI